MPGELHVNITMNTAAFDSDDEEWRMETSRILRKFALHLETGVHDGSTILMDVNGNRVGEAWDDWRSHEEEALDDDDDGGGEKSSRLLVVGKVRTINYEVDDLCIKCGEPETDPDGLCEICLKCSLCCDEDCDMFFINNPAR